MSRVPAPDANRDPRRPFDKGRGEKAQTFVEFAFVVPLFFILVMGVIDFGWGLKHYVTITNAAREGARYGITCKATEEIKQRVVDFSDNALSLADVEVLANPCTGSPASYSGPDGQPVTVKVTFEYEYITPIGGLLNLVSGGVWPKTWDMTSTTSMRVE